MKKVWLIVYATLFFATLPIYAAERNVVGNTFQSSYPKMNINVDPQFKYLGKTDNTRDKKRKEDYDDYIFAPKDQGGRFNKYVFIQIRSRKNPFTDNAWQNEKNLDFNKIQIDGESFNYYKRLMSMPTNSLVVKFINKAGYVIPACGIVNSFYAFPYENMRVGINYVEDAFPLDMSCQRTYSRDALSENQKSYLADFHNRAFASIGLGGRGTTQQVVPTATTPSSAFTRKEDSSKKSAKADGATPISSLSVFNFNATNLDASKYGPEVTNMLTDALSKNQAFSIISRHDLLEFLSLNDLQQNDNLENMVNIGNRLGLNFIVAGRIEKKGVILEIKCIVVDIHDNKVIFTRKVQALGDSNLATEISKMSDSIVATIAAAPSK